MIDANCPPGWSQLREDIFAAQRPAVEDADALRRARALFLLEVKGRPLRRAPRRWSRVWQPAFAVAAAAALGIGAWSQYQSQAALSFDTGSQHAHGELGALLTSPAEPLPVHFSDGTVLSMAEDTRARVTETHAEGATVVLEEGTISAAVVHRGHSNWHVAAGPYTVVVTGTKFDVRWNATHRELSLDLHEGSVTLLGPNLGPSGRRVTPGEKIRLAVEVPAASAPVAVAGESTAANPEPTAFRDQSSKISRDSNATGAARPSWQKLAQDERYADALAAAESEGFDAACRRATGPDLLLLGNAARFSGSTSRADQVFRMVRARFPRTHEAAISAFFLGRMAYDERRSFQEAARWFRIYLDEEPSGGVAREAAGRLIEAERSAGDLAAARESARSYLAKYPAGPHSGLARSLVSPSR